MSKKSGKPNRLAAVEPALLWFSVKLLPLMLSILMRVLLVAPVESRPVKIRAPLAACWRMVIVVVSQPVGE